MRALGLHQITAMEASPLELVSIAAAVGCPAVCVFVNLPGEPKPAFPAVTTALTGDMVARMNDLGVLVSNVEYFPLGPNTVVEDFRAGLALGAELGARRAVTHIHDPVEARGIDNLGRLGEMAAEFGLDVGLEFMGLTSACDSIQRGVHFVNQVARLNVGVAIDMLHLIRTGGAPADVAAVPPHLIKYAQICDGADLAVSSDYLAEAIEARLVPGAGCFPVLEILQALPPATALDVEVPRRAQQTKGVPAVERAREAVAAARRLIESADQGRDCLWGGNRY